MIRCHLGRMMGERKLKISDVARKTGLNRSTITSLYQETATRVDVDTIEKLCKLFDCKVGEIFEYVATDAPLSLHTQGEVPKKLYK